MIGFQFRLTSCWNDNDSFLPDRLSLVVHNHALHLKPVERSACEVTNGGLKVHYYTAQSKLRLVSLRASTKILGAYSANSGDPGRMAPSNVGSTVIRLL